MLVKNVGIRQKCWKKTKNVGENVGRRQTCWGKCWIETKKYW